MKNELGPTPPKRTPCSGARTRRLRSRMFFNPSSCSAQPQFRTGPSAPPRRGDRGIDPRPANYRLPAAVGASVPHLPGPDRRV